MVVTSLVWGIIVSENTAPLTSLVVRLIPSTVIDPFLAIYLAKLSGALISITVARASSYMATTSPKPSTWPATKCPPKRDRKSTRLNSSHVAISYAVFCLKKKKKTQIKHKHTTDQS